MGGGKTEHEERIEEIFGEVTGYFQKLDTIKDSVKQKEMLKDITSLLKDAKALIKEFELEARSDGMPAKELAQRRKVLVDDLNDFIALKKGYSEQTQNKAALLEGAQEPIERPTDGMGVKEIIQLGRKEVAEIDQALLRAEKLVENTKEIATTTAATLNDQSKQMDKIVDDLNEIEMDMKTAARVLRDIGKGLVTDKCIMFLMLVAVCGVVALIVLKVINPKKASEGIQAAYNDTCNSLNVTCNVTGTIQELLNRLTGRKLLGESSPGVRLVYHRLKEEER